MNGEKLQQSLIGVRGWLDGLPSHLQVHHAEPSDQQRAAALNVCNNLRTQFSLTAFRSYTELNTERCFEVMNPTILNIGLIVD